MNCPTCERHGDLCAYCHALCGTVEMPTCVCACHVADVEREAKVSEERVERIRRAFEQR